MFVPTNRDCSSSIPDRFQELAWASEQKNLNVTFCLIEHAVSAKISGHHREILQNYADRGVSIIHLTEPIQRTMVKTLLSNERLSAFDRGRLSELLLPTGVSYGRGPNLASLLAAGLNCSSIHRRDSDVYIDPLRPNSWPLELELGAIAVEPSEINTLVVRNLDDPTIERGATTKVVGTGTFGAATIDRRDLFSAGLEFAVAFQQLGRPGVPVEDVTSEAIGYLIEEPKIRYDEDFYEIDIDARVEMEACCLSELQNFLPEMPTDVLGCDYMVKDLAWRIGQPILFHSRKMEHRYDPSRELYVDVQAAVDYAVRDLQYIQMGRIWRQQGTRMQEDLSQFWDDSQLNADAYAASFREFANSSTAELVRVRTGAQKVYQDASRAVEGSIASRLAATAETIASLGSQIDQHVVSAVDDFAYLVEAWRGLAASADTLEEAVRTSFVYQAS